MNTTPFLRAQGLALAGTSLYLLTTPAPGTTAVLAQP